MIAGASINRKQSSTTRKGVERSQPQKCSSVNLLFFSEQFPSSSLIALFMVETFRLSSTLKTHKINVVKNLQLFSTQSLSQHPNAAKLRDSGPMRLNAVFLEFNLHSKMLSTRYRRAEQTSYLTTAVSTAADVRKFQLKKKVPTTPKSFEPFVSKQTTIFEISQALSCRVAVASSSSSWLRHARNEIDVK